MSIGRDPQPSSKPRSAAFLRVGTIGAALAALTVGGVVVAAPSQAGACSETGGNSNKLMWTGSGYTCAYVASSGNKKIGMWATSSWTSSTAKGYKKRYNCNGQSGGVSVKNIYTDSGGTNLGSSITYTATNGSSGSRHWNAAVLWNTSSKGSVAGDQYKQNCSTNYSIGVNGVYQSKVTLSGPTSITAGTSATFTASVSNPDGGPTPSGKVYLFVEATPNVRNTPAKDCSGKETNTKTPLDTAVAQGTISNNVATLVTPPLNVPSGAQFYAVFGGQPLTSAGLAAHCLTPPQADGLTPAVSNVLSVSTRSGTAQTPDARVPARGDLRRSNPRLSVVNTTVTAPAPLTARCPVGKAPVQLSLASRTAVLDPDNLRRSKSGAALSTNGLPEGTEVALQLVCRPVKAKAAVLPGVSWGSTGSDSLSSNRKGSALFGGLGNDQLRVTNAKSIAWGGPGNDSATLRAKNTAAAGGPGSDRLVSMTSGKSLLRGGPGKDILIGGPGKTLINALDGKGGDTITCNSRRNVVLLDAGDRTNGPCKIIKRR